MRTRAPNDLIGAIVRLRESIARRKGRIRTEKRLLAAEAAELEMREAECRRIGLPLVIVPPTGAGAIHGHDLEPDQVPGSHS